MLAGSFSSILDEVKDEKRKTFRIAVAEGALGMGIVVGCIIPVFMEERTSYAYLMMACVVAYTIGTIYVVVFVRETKFSTKTSGDTDVSDITTPAQRFSCCDLVTGVLHEYRDMFRTLTKPRNRNKRNILMVSTVCFFVFFAMEFGERFEHFHPFFWQSMPSVMSGL